MEYMNKLIIIAIVAKEVVEGAAGQDHLYFRITRQRINALRRALETLKNSKNISLSITAGTTD
jgi:hypothetical protein